MILTGCETIGQQQGDCARHPTEQCVFDLAKTQGKKNKRNYALGKFQPEIAFDGVLRELRNELCGRNGFQYQKQLGTLAHLASSNAQQHPETFEPISSEERPYNQWTNCYTPDSPEPFQKFANGTFEYRIQEEAREECKEDRACIAEKIMKSIKQEFTMFCDAYNGNSIGTAIETRNEFIKRYPDYWQENWWNAFQAKKEGTRWECKRSSIILKGPYTVEFVREKYQKCLDKFYTEKSCKSPTEIAEERKSEFDSQRVPIEKIP